MEERDEDHPDRGQLLGGTDQGLRDCSIRPGRRRQEGPGDGVARNSIRGPYQMEGVPSREAFGRGSLHRRLWKGCSRWVGALRPSSIVVGSSGGRMDASGRGNGEDRGRRKKRERSSSTGSRKKKKKKKEKKDKGEDKKKEKDKKEIQGVKNLTDVFGKTGLDPRHGTRRKMLRRAKKVAKKLRGRRRIEHFRRGDQGEVGVGQGARCFDLGSDLTDADVIGETVGGALGVEPRSGTPHLQPVLAPIPPSKNEWADESRSSDDLFRPGLVDPGEDCSGVRRFDSEGQIFGTNFRRIRLSNLATPRVGSTRGLKLVDQCRDLRCLQTTPGGAQGQSCIQQRRLGKKERRSRSLGRQRKGKEQRFKRKRQEGKLEKGRRKRRKRSEEERRLKGLVEEKEVDESEGIEEKFHGEKSQGRSQEPTQIPPMVFEPGVSLGSLVETLHDEKDEKESEEGRKRGEEFLEERTLGNVPGGAANVELLSAKGLEGKSFGEVAPMMLKVFGQCLQDAKLKHSKVKTSGGIFPLPETLQELQLLGSNVADGSPSLLLCVCRAMNSYYGVAAASKTIPSKARMAAVRSLKAYVDGVLAWEENLESGVGSSWWPLGRWTIGVRKLEWQSNFDGKIWPPRYLIKLVAFPSKMYVNWVPFHMCRTLRTIYFPSNLRFILNHLELW